MVSNLVQSLISLGVETVVSCPGGRSSAILNAILDSKKIQVETFYDERSAGFYALGKSIKTSKPVVALTTSGSAVVALYPAALEAKYREEGKLILLTADRPENFAGTGAPQSICQKSIFETNGVKTILFNKEEGLKDITYPVHINVNLPEPNPQKSLDKTEKHPALLIVSSLKLNEREEVKRYLKNYSGPLVLESLSNLSSEDFPKAKLINQAEDFIVKKGLKSFSKVYRIGGVPILKSWREAFEHLEVYYWDKYAYPGAVGAKGLCLEEIAKQSNGLDCDPLLVEEIDKHHNRVEALLREHQESEASKLLELTKIIPEGSQVFIGNSMPIREWEFVGWQKYINLGQRGVNGIDGSLALALGALDEHKENWIILGDLTSLYNINDFQILKALLQYKVRIVVVNNSGGRIFSKIFSKNLEYFVNKQECSFENLAKLWGLDYMDELTKIDLPQHLLLEIKIDPEKTSLFWKDMESTL